MKFFESNKHWPSVFDSPIEQLAKDVQLQIFSLLDEKDWLQCALVSKKWNALASDKSLWKKAGMAMSKQTYILEKKQSYLQIYNAQIRAAQSLVKQSDKPCTGKRLNQYSDASEWISISVFGSPSPARIFFYYIKHFNLFVTKFGGRNFLDLENDILLKKYLPRSQIILICVKSKKEVAYYQDFISKTNQSAILFFIVNFSDKKDLNEKITNTFLWPSTFFTASFFSSIMDRVEAMSLVKLLDEKDLSHLEKSNDRIMQFK